MANLKIDWFGRSLSRRADKTGNTYAKVNSITGKTFLVTLRNPYTSDRFKDAPWISRCVPVGSPTFATICRTRN